MTNDKAQMSNQARNPSDRRNVFTFWHLDFDIFLVTASVALFFFFTSSAYAAPFNGPWGRDSRQQDNRKQGGAPPNAFRFLVEMYRENISPIDGKDCPMYPSCSEYSIRSFKKHGFFVGWMMTVDRLFRCGRDELRLSPQVMVDGERRWYDPIENNDFWWHHDR